MSLRSITSQALKRRGIDLRQFKTLLLVYLKQDLRGSRAFNQFSASEYVKSNRALLAMVSIYLLLGLMLGSLAFTANMDVFHYSIITLTYTLFIIALAILAESGSVIFNEAETDVLGHLPVSPQTHFAAKVANLFSFTLLLAAAANFFPMIMGIWAAGSSPLFVIAHAISASLVALLATAIVMVSYGLLMRFVSRERFDSIVTYSQVALVLFFMFGFQILPRIIETNRFLPSPEFKWYYLAFPPAWFSGVAMLLMGKLEPGAIALALLAVLSLLTLGAVALRKVAAGYSALLSEMVYREGKPKVKVDKREVIKRERGFLRTIKAAILRDPAERAVFELVSLYMLRNREIKVRLYPSLAYFIFFPLLAVFTRGLPDPFVSDEGGFSLMATAMICFVSLTAIEGLVFSEHFAAAYIFRVAPVASLAHIHNGLRKAVLLWIALPGFAALLALYSILWASPLHALLVLGPWMIMTPAVLMIPFLLREVIPLARKYQKGQQTARNVWIFASSMVVLSVVGFFQLLTIKGGIPPIEWNFPYWLFIAVIAGISGLVYALLRGLGERRQILPSDRDG